MLHKSSRLIFCMLSIFLISSCAELKNAGKAIGQGAKEITTSIGHASRDTVKEIGKNTEKAVDDMNNDSEK